MSKEVLNEYAKAKMSGMSPGSKTETISVDLSTPVAPTVQNVDTYGTEVSSPKDELLDKINKEELNYLESRLKAAEKTSKLQSYLILAMILSLITLTGLALYFTTYQPQKTVQFLLKGNQHLANAVSLFYSQPLEPGETRMLKVKTTCNGVTKSIDYKELTKL